MSPEKRNSEQERLDSITQSNFVLKLNNVKEKRRVLCLFL
jgi:hypothetical protein